MIPLYSMTILNTLVIGPHMVIMLSMSILRRSHLIGNVSTAHAFPTEELNHLYTWFFFHIEIQQEIQPPKLVLKNCTKSSKMSTTQGTGEMNEQGGIETKVETVDYRSPAGKDREATKEKVGVVHLIRDKGSSGSSGGILASAADAVSKTIKSAKDAVWGSSNK